MQVSTLIFDVDGTLADTERDGHRIAFNQAFQAAGLDWTWSEALYGELLQVTGGKERIKHYLDHYHTQFNKPEAFDDFVAELHAAKTTFYTQLVAAGAIALRPGVERLIQEARNAGMRLAIATTTTPTNVSALLKHCLHPQAESWFAVIAAGDMAAVKKPAADIYHAVLRALDVAPQDCFAFEDSENGVRSALGAGIATLVTINPYTKEQSFTGAAMVVDHLGEPDAPFKVIAGDAPGGHSMVTLALIEALAGA